MYYILKRFQRVQVHLQIQRPFICYKQCSNSIIYKHLFYHMILSKRIFTWCETLYTHSTLYTKILRNFLYTKSINEFLIFRSNVKIPSRVEQREYNNIVYKVTSLAIFYKFSTRVCRLINLLMSRKWHLKGKSTFSLGFLDNNP